MSVLVTGGAGYIGSHMALELLDAGEPVVVLDNLSTGSAWAVPKGATFVEGDVGDQSLVAARASRASGVDAIIHFAGSIVVPDSVADPLGYYLNNTVKSRALMEMAVKCGIRHFIFSSTAAVYGMTGDQPVAEDAPLAPLSPYGSSKRMTEIMLADTGARRTICATWRCATSMSPAPTRRAAPASRPRAPPTSSRSPARRRSASAATCRCSAPTIRPPTAPACATTSMSPISRARTWRRCATCVRAAPATSSTAAMAAGSRCWR